MSEVIKDPAIKLFGMTIALDKAVAAAYKREEEQQQSSTTTSSSYDNKIGSEGELTVTKQDDNPTNPTAEISTKPATPSKICDEPKTLDKDSLSPENPNEEEPSDSSVSQEMMLKKPDKIIPCPRCNSMDTKFCYYNNYNVNQPRHFCKNCQRYWTAGGTMRNVPVGSGRRKSKNASASNYSHMIVSDAFQAAQAVAVNGMHFPSLKTNGTVLMFGSESGQCKTIDSVLHPADRSQNLPRNGFSGPEKRYPFHQGIREIGNDHSSGSSSTITNLTRENNQESGLKHFQHLHSQLPCFSGPPWNSAHSRSSVPPSGFPVTLYHATPNWSCTAPSHWNVPWLFHPPFSDNSALSSSSTTTSTLGKHSRDGNILRQANLETADASKGKGADRCVLIPKTLRIGDPNLAAKSSIWKSLGINMEKNNSINGTSIFRASASKGDGNNSIDSTSLVLQANPAALSRSLNFHESV